jgi:hypothetical protein
VKDEKDGSRAEFQSRVWFGKHESRYAYHKRDLDPSEAGAGEAGSVEPPPLQ